MLRCYTPGNAFNLARCLAATGNPVEAAENYRLALELNPKHLPSLLNYGDLLASRQQKVEARSKYEAFLSLWKGAPRVAAQVRQKIKALQ